MESKNLSMETISELYNKDIQQLKKKLATKYEEDDIPKTKFDRKLKELFQETKDLEVKKYIDTHVWLSSDSTVYFYEEGRFVFRHLKSFKANQGEALPLLVSDYLFKSCVSRYVVNVFKDEKNGVNYEKKRINLMEEPKYKLDLDHKETEDVKSVLDRFYKEFFFEVISNSANDVYEHFLNCLAGQIQQIKILCIPFLYSSAQGTGKSTILEILKALIGKQYYLTCLHDWVATGNMAGKCCCVIEETADGSDLRSQMNTVKSMCTNTGDYTYKSLYKDPKEFVCVNNIWGTSNYRPAEMEGRRWFFLPVSTKRLGDTEFWKSVYSIINDEHLLYCLAQRLLKRDLSQVNFNQEPPKGAKIEIIRDSMRLTYKWIRDVFIFPQKTQRLRRNAAYERFKEYLAEKAPKMNVQKSTFTYDLAEIGIKPTLSTGYEVFDFNHDELRSLFIAKNFTDDLEINEYNLNTKDKATSVFVTVETLQNTIESQKQEIASLKAEIERLKRTPQKEEQIPEKVVEKVVEKKRKVPHRNLQAAVISLGELL